MRLIVLQGGHQEDAEEFLGFFLDSLEEELLAMSKSFSESSSSPAPPQNPNDDDDWLEVGRKNKAVVTRTVSRSLKYYHSCIQLIPFQTKTADSPTTRIFRGKFRSAVRVPGQRESVTIEDWRSLRLDIQVCVAGLSFLPSHSLEISL